VPTVPAFEVPPRDRAVVPCASVEARPTAQGDWRVRFTLRADAAGGARSAQVAGSFTGWQGRPVAMARAADGSFTAETTVPDGRHAYKFVLDGSRWIADPANPARADDQNGGFNSVLALGADPYDYSVNYVGASVRYYFGSRKLSLPE